MGQKTQYAYIMVGQMNTIDGQTHTLLQWEYHSTKTYVDPFNEIVLDVQLTTPSGKELIIPTFWMDQQRWAVRYIAEEIGLHKLTTRCSDTQNKALHAVEDEIFITEGENTPLNQISLSEDKSYLTTKNNQPFFWLSDTWWMALSKRLSYPKDFKRLTDKRKEQGFNVIMLVAGLFPDMGSFDERASNEAGLPWIANEQGRYHTINPAYFDEADKRIAHLVAEDLIPCILGSWGYYLLQMGEEKMQQHWRYIIARWGAYPVVWCIAGEATMPYYLSKQRHKEMHLLHEGWSKMATYIKSLDPFDRLLTIHPTEIGREQIKQKDILDINLLQAAHNGYDSVSTGVQLLKKEYHTTHIPTIMSEVNYEGILRDTHADVQRLTFWASVLSGSKGYGYGANGVWQFNTPTQPFGTTPNGATWGDTPWQESFLYTGAKHIGYAKKLLERYTWWLLEPQQHYLEPVSEYTDAKAPRMAGIDDTLRIAYFYLPVPPWQTPKYRVTHLTPLNYYKAYFWNPKTDKEYPIGSIQSTESGIWEINTFPSMDDWVLVLEKSKEEQTVSDDFSSSLFTKIVVFFKNYKL